MARRTGSSLLLVAAAFGMLYAGQLAFTGLPPAARAASKMPMQVMNGDDERSAAKPTVDGTPFEVILTSQSAGIRTRYSFTHDIKLKEVKKIAIQELRLQDIVH